MSDENLYCPTCGKPTRYRISPEWILGEFEGRYANILAALLEARREKRGLSITDLCEAAYIEYEYDKTRMPSDPVTTVQVLMRQRQGRLGKLGWTIATPSDTRNNGYWLVPVDME